MAISRRSRSTLGALLASTLMLTGAASAQATPTITSPLPGAYINDTTPTVHFSDVATGVDVNLEVGGDIAGTTPEADISGGVGQVTADADVSNGTGTNYRIVNLVVREDDGSGVNGAFDDVSVNMDQIPSLSGPADNTIAWAAESIDYAVMDAIPFNDVVLYSDGVEVDRKVADADGEVASLKPDAPLTPGAHTLTAVTVDDALVESSPETFELNITPTAPHLSGLFNNAQLNRSPPAVTITDVDADASKVTLYEVIQGEDADPDTFDRLGETTLVPGDSDGTETVTLTTPLSNGEHTLLARQTVNSTETDDYQSGNEWTTVNVKTSAPVLTSDDAGKLIKNKPYFEVTGALQNSGTDAMVELYIDGTLAGSEESDSFGESGLYPGAVTDGAHTAYVVTVDDLGHRSTVHSNEVTFTLDTVAPAAPTFTSPTAGAALTTNTPLVTLHSEPGARVYMYAGDYTDEYSAIADGNGNVTFTLSRALAEGENTLGANASDAAGNYGDYSDTTFSVKTVATAPPTPPVVVVPPVVTPPVTTPKNPVDVDGDGIDNNWLVGGKAAAAPATPKAKVSAGKVELKLTAVPKGATKVRVYRADGKGGYKLVKTLSAKSKTFTDKTVKGGHTYKYKTVGVNAKGQQGTASKPATAKVKKK